MVEVAYHPSIAQSSLASRLQKSDDAAGPIRGEFLAEKANELGFSVEELNSAIEAWTKSVQDAYQRGLAALYDGRYAQASQLISESLNTPNGNVLTHYVSLASAEYEQGHYPAAESALRKVLTAHPDDPLILNNLAVVLHAQARYIEAETLYKRALAINEKALGPEHSDVATNLCYLALLYSGQSPLSRAKTSTLFAGMVIPAEHGSPWSGGPSDEIPPPFPCVQGLGKKSYASLLKTSYQPPGTGKPSL